MASTILIYSWGMTRAGRSGSASDPIFPLSIDAGGRFLRAANGVPFFLQGDTPWSLAAQLTNAEITQYLNNRSAKGFTAIMFNAPERYFTSQTPTYNNVDGVSPFTSMTDYASAMTAYWNRVDHIVNSAKALGMVCIINPAYLGFGGGAQGWFTEVSAETDADLQTYGASLANRYTQGNVIWCMGGDFDGNSAGDRSKQWNIVTGIRSVRTTDLVTAHPSPGNVDGYANWNSLTGFNLNFTYPGDSPVYADCATSYGRAGPTPFFMGEAVYEQERGTPISEAGLRRQSYQALLSGACGQFFGNNPIWHFEAPNALFTYTGTWETNLDSNGSAHQVYVKQLFSAFAWHLLIPKTDASLVSSALGTNDTRICPALSSDGTFALIWVPSSQTITVVTNALTGIAGNVRIRRFNVTAGDYTTITASVAKSAGESVATGAEGVIVVDAA